MVNFIFKKNVKPWCVCVCVCSVSVFCKSLTTAQRCTYRYECACTAELGHLASCHTGLTDVYIRSTVTIFGRRYKLVKGQVGVNSMLLTIMSGA